MVLLGTLRYVAHPLDPSVVTRYLAVVTPLLIGRSAISNARKALKT